MLPPLFGKSQESRMNTEESISTKSRRNQITSGSIRTKLVAIFAAVAVLSMGMVAFLGDRSLRNNLTAGIVESQGSLATSQGFQIGQAIISQFDKLKGLATVRSLQEGAETASLEEIRPSDTAEIEQLNLAWRAIVADNNIADPLAVKLRYNPLAIQLRNFQETFPENVEVLLTDQKGFSIASTNLPTNYYQADSLWWRTAHTTGQYIGQPIFNPATNSIALDIAVPVYSYRTGEFVGVLRATVSFDALTSLLAEGFRGQTGYSMIYQPNGQQIKLQALEDGNYKIVQDFASSDLQHFSESPNTSMELSLDGIPVLASSAPVKSYSNTLLKEGTTALEDLDWQVVVVQEKAEALQFVNVQTRNNLILVTIIALVVIIIAYFLARFITHPIIHLNAVAIQIASGDLTAEAKVETRDEIGRLATTFNNMTSQLRSLFGSLEQRVLDRTHDLELASEVGRTITEKIADLDELLTMAVEMIRTRFGLYYTQVYLTDPSGQTLVLRAGTGEVGEKLLSSKHNLTIDSNSLNGQAVLEKKPIIVADTLQSSNFKPNPLLPNTRSEIVVPLIAGGRVIGVLDMQSERPEALNETNLAAFETLAGQLAIAIQNAALLQQAKEARAEVEAQIRQRTEEGWQELLDAVTYEQKFGFAYDLTNITRLSGDESSVTPQESLSSPLIVMGAKLGMIKVTSQQDHSWTSGDAEIVHAAATQLAQHIENLRLLAQAKRYQAQAEQAVRRLTWEGWDAYLHTNGNAETGYSYDLNRVQPLSANGKHPADPSLQRSLIIGDEPIGQLELDLPSPSEETIEIISAVAEQLSGHIENLRLLEQTQQRSSELEEAQSFLDSVIENLPTMLFVKDAEDLSFVRWNKAAENLTGFGSVDLIGKNDYDFFPKEEADLFTSIDRQVLTNGELLDVPEEELATVHQGTRYMHTRKVPILGTDGKPKYLLGLAEDITERKKSEEIITRRAQELETVAKVSTTASTVLDPEKLLQSVVDLTKERFGLYHAHIYLINPDENALVLTAGAGEIGKQMLSQGWSIPVDHELSIIADAYRRHQSVVANDVYHDKESTFLSNRLLPDTRSEMALPLIVGDRVLGVFDVQSEIVNYFTEENVNIYTILASQVAVALQNARLYVEQAATVTQLRELDRLKSSFLANMSHELRTPLNSILGFTDVILEGMDGPLTENMDNDLRLVQKNGQHLLHLINDVLDMAKIEAGRMNLNPELFKVHEVFAEVTSITSTLASEKSLSLSIECDSDQNVEIYADRTRLRQVMINLVNNSIKFTDQGQIALNVSPMEGARVRISVSDTGMGIPPENLESIFQEFTQVDSSTTRKAGGTGLGLPISRRLVEMHGGRLWAESTGNSGEGSTFFVELPVEARITEVVEKQAK
jgi:PAS domain S-box-containing protein